MLKQESLRSSGNLWKTKNTTWSPQSQTSSSGRSSVATFLKTTFTFRSSSFNHLVQFHYDASPPQWVKHLHIHWRHCAVVEDLWTMTLTKKYTATATLTSIGNKIKCGRTQSMSPYNPLWPKTDLYDNIDASESFPEWGSQRRLNYVRVLPVWSSTVINHVNMICHP